MFSSPDMSYLPGEFFPYSAAILKKICMIAGVKVILVLRIFLTAGVWYYGSLFDGGCQGWGWVVHFLKLINFLTYRSTVL